MVEFEDPETNELVVVDASAYRRDYQSEIAAFRAMMQQRDSRERRQGAQQRRHDD